MQDTYSTTMRSEALAKDWMDGDGITGSGGLQIGCREEPALEKQLETGMRVNRKVTEPSLKPENLIKAMSSIEIGNQESFSTPKRSH